MCGRALTGARIETIHRAWIPLLADRRALTGARIDTRRASFHYGFFYVAPSRARGLKHSLSDQQSNDRECRALTGARIETGPSVGCLNFFRVAPSRARGLKLCIARFHIQTPLVAPSRARGLKLPCLWLVLDGASRALTGARIET